MSIQRVCEKLYHGLKKYLNRYCQRGYLGFYFTIHDLTEYQCTIESFGDSFGRLRLSSRKSEDSFFLGLFTINFIIDSFTSSFQIVLIVDLLADAEPWLDIHENLICEIFVKKRILPFSFFIVEEKKIML